MSSSGQALVSRLERIPRSNAVEYSCQLSRGDAQIDVRIVRRKRKSMALYVEKGSLPELRVPTRCAWRDINQFLCGRFDWILAAEDELSRRKLTPPNRYHQGGLIRFLGEDCRLMLARSRHQVVEKSGSEIYLSCAHPEDEKRVEHQVLNWYRRHAERLFAERISLVNQGFMDSRSPNGLRIRKMKSRWGSCGSNGEICLNLMLMREDLSQIDFVVAHELCHLRHFHHNKAFYALLDDIMPDWRERETSLASSG